LSFRLFFLRMISIVVPKRSSHLIYIAFLFSGLASLLFQIVMMRQFGLIFGVGLVSSAVVIGIFLLGLGTGSFFGGILARQYYPAQPKKLVYSYVLVEIFLALLTTASVLLFAKFESVSALLSNYVVGEHGWFYLDSFSVAARIAVAFVAVFPSACLMGFGFPLLTCFEQLKPGQRISDTVSYLYAFNTFGAALACLFADTIFIPKMGLVGVQAFIVGCYTVGVLAVLLGCRRFQPITEINLTNEPPTVNASKVSGFGLLMMVFLSGFFSIALEMIWLRFTSGFVGQRRISASMVLFVFLFFVQIGSFLSPRLVRRFKNTAGLFVVLQGLALFTAVLFLSVYSEEFGVPTQTYFEGQSILLAALKLVALPAFFFGVSFPVLNLLLHAERVSIASSTGLVFLLNSIGAFAASLLTAYFLIPLLGIQNSLTLLLGVLIIAGFVFSKNERSVWVVAVVAALCILPLQLISPEDFLRLPGRFKAVETILPSPQLAQLIEGQQFTVAAVYSGEDNKRRILLSNGFVMSGNARFVRRNMRSAVHLPMLMQTKPESALTICYGIGNAASSILLHPSITKLEIVDVSKDILELSPHFENDNKGVLKDPRTQVFVNDGRQHLRMQSKEKYDFVTIDPPPLYFAGIDSLYDLEFNRLVYRSLKPGGIMSLWLPMWHLDKELNRAVIRTFVAIFDDVMMIESGFGNYV
jgi:spermidine synthase